MRKINVLFMQSQSYFGADSLIHANIMRHLNRDRVTVHAACNYGSADEKSAAFKALETIPDLHLRPTDFGPSVNDRSISEVTRELARGASAAASLGGLVGYLRKHRIDIVHGTEKPRDAFYGLLIGRLGGARCITHLHVKVENWISPLVRWAMKYDDGLISISDFVTESAVQMGYRRERIHCVLNSLDLDKWDKPLDGSSIRGEFGIAPDLPTFAIVSRLFPWKGHTELLKALAKVKESTPRFRLLIVGEDDPRATPGGGSYLAELKKLRAELALEEQVVFTGFRSDIANILAASDIFTMPSFEEPFGVAYLEAMALKKPVIALDSGGVPQLVDHGKAGLLSPPYDIDQLASNILVLLRDPERRKLMGAYGRRRVEEYFNPVRMANEIEEVYRRVLAA